MPKKSAKVERILDIAIELLKTEGDFGVTMRKVASVADMSLSNVQYYFKTKDDLLKAVADRYFQQCLDDLRALPVMEEEKALRPIVSMLLSHGHELSDMCRIFREYWAISTRNESIESYLSDYYQTMVVVMKEKIAPLAKDQTSQSRAVSILIPFVEGYSVTAKAMPVSLDEMVDTIEAILLVNLRGDY